MFKFCVVSGTKCAGMTIHDRDAHARLCPARRSLGSRGLLSCPTFATPRHPTDKSYPEVSCLPPPAAHASPAHACMHACMQLNCERTPCPQSIAKEHETETSLHPGVHACKARMVRALTWAFDLYAHSRRAKAVRWSKALLRDTGAQIRILVPRRHTGATQGGPGHVPLCLLLVCASLPTYRSHRGGVLRCAEKGARLVSTSDSP